MFFLIFIIWIQTCMISWIIISPIVTKPYIKSCFCKYKCGCFICKIGNPCVWIRKLNQGDHYSRLNTTCQIHTQRGWKSTNHMIAIAWGILLVVLIYLFAVLLASNNYSQISSDGIIFSIVCFFTSLIVPAICVSY